MNYASVVFMFFAVVSAVWYFAYAKDHFTGPGSMDLEGEAPVVGGTGAGELYGNGRGELSGDGDAELHKGGLAEKSNGHSAKGNDADTLEASKMA